MTGPGVTGPAVKRRYLLLLLATPLLLLVLVLKAAEKNTPAAAGTSHGLPWHCLEFEAEHMIFKAKTRLCLQEANPEDLKIWLPAGDPKEPKLSENRPGTQLLDLQVESDIVGRKSTDRTFFENTTGRVLQRTKVKLGKDPYRKSFRFTESALEWTRSAPISSQEAQQGEPAWSKIEYFDAPYPQDPGCQVHSEPVTLLYLAAAHDWNAESKIELCIYASKHWNRVEAKSIGLESLDVTYEQGGKEHKVQQARVIVLKAKGAGQSSGDDLFELMGLKGDIRIYLEPKSNLPLAIRGEMPWVGEVLVHLTKAEL